MAKKSTSTLTSAKKTVKKTEKVETVSVKLQLPGQLAETAKVRPTVAELIEDNLAKYEVSVNGQKVAADYKFAKNDIVRVGIPTKSAN